jgi:hypothetical protein
MSKKKLKAAFEAGRNTSLTFKEWRTSLPPTPKFKIGDILQANAGGWAFNESGLELAAAISCLPSRKDHHYSVCTRVTYSKRHKIYFYKIGNFENMFTENCIKKIKL